MTVYVTVWPATRPLLGVTDFTSSRSALRLTDVVTDAVLGCTPGSTVGDTAVAEFTNDVPAKLELTVPTMVIVVRPTPRSPSEHTPVATTHEPLEDDIEFAIKPAGIVSVSVTAEATDGPWFSTVTV